MRIKTEDAIAIAIDFQEKLMPAIKNREEVLKNSSILLRGLKALEVPVLVTQQYTKGLGESVEEIKDALGDFTPFDKITFSVYQNAGVREALEMSGRKNVIICGTEAHVCVLQSVIDLREAGYNVVLVEDCIGSRRKDNKKTGVQRALSEGALLTSYEAILFELTQTAKSPCFKTISNLVK